MKLTESRTLRLLLMAAVASLILNAGILIAGSNGRPLAVAGPGPGGARHLMLAPGLSFTDDSSSNFPIRGENIARAESPRIGRR